MQTDQESVAAYYNQTAEQEWQRGERHRTEFAITRRALQAHLPPPPARLLDCGGGPGRYALALAQLGYQVTLFDLSQGNLALAQQKAAEQGIQLQGYALGTATDLSRFLPGSFDAVLLMGPLYHLLDQADRENALRQAWQVLKPGGLLAAAFITRYAALRDAAAKYPQELLPDRAVYERIQQTGQLPPAADGDGRFVAYFAHPDEAERLVVDQGFELRQVFALEGVVAGHEEHVNQLQGPDWDAWLELNFEAAQDACLRGAADHLLLLAARPGWRDVLGRVAARLEQAGVPYKVVGGTCAALHGVSVPVQDVDLETTLEGAERIQEMFAGQMILPVAWRTGEQYRSHFGQMVIDGLKFDIMAELEWRVSGGWVRVQAQTECMVELDGQPVRTVWLEEETAAYLRRRRFERASLCLPRCDGDRLLRVLQTLGNKKG